MHIKNIVDYVKNEIKFSREFCEDNVFVTLRIEPIERIIENLEQKDKDNISYAEDLAETQCKYDNLVKNIKDKVEELEEDLEIYDTDSEDLIIAKYEQRAMLDLLQKILKEAEEWTKN